MKTDKDLLELKELFELQEIRDIITEKLITRDEWNKRMINKIDMMDIDKEDKERLKEKYKH